MEDFIALNPGVVMAFIGVLFSLLALMFGVITWLFKAKQAAEKESTDKMVVALTRALEEVKVSLKSTATEVFTWVRGAENRISRLEAQHEQNHGAGYDRRITDFPNMHR